jgi:1-(5-phosphoribosyl)-5-[(5-phosphoribosylamino)methylideneamino] imidazole-4-carboxamide isomerase/N-(5'phosphoribosyl)anthranilate isomerase
MKKLELLPAIDIKDGNAIRLIKGELGNQSKHGDPLEIAQSFQKNGARWIHLVDLDAAFGTGSNFELIRRVIDAVDLKIELSGGIRDDETLARAVSTGCERIVIGTSAIENPLWTAAKIKSYGDLIAVALDVRGRKLSTRGWTKNEGELFETLQSLTAAGCAKFIVTDIDRDGYLNGPNIRLLQDVAAKTDVPIIASGGVATLADIDAIANLVGIGVEAAIVGKALYTGAFTLAEALQRVN